MHTNLTNILTQPSPFFTLKLILFKISPFYWKFKVRFFSFFFDKILFSHFKRVSINRIKWCPFKIFKENSNDILSSFSLYLFNFLLKINTFFYWNP
ncbi:hypothetical protein NBO_820g0001 [Nosema bombycis CQ1]|uniref:Uncharacterized protein n=1 Tax=Nosema bombycis (strain CQ1 / CVCC 102059) TaxID=578461 RepID=R0M193_NOSB1|nr:hypothetical protein NBO_820g0001 [Nosema bombycis CQ1]|eukprot:EOB11794.1 hypothetical protein NBO_820g0001 [Nosema bombycis CQ1]